MVGVVVAFALKDTVSQDFGATRYTFAQSENKLQSIGNRFDTKNRYAELDNARFTMFMPFSTRFTMCKAMS